jgi:hypothetical protein
MYTLLTASQCDKQTLGVGMLGEMLIRDMPQQAINFLYKESILLAPAVQSLARR